MFLSDLIFSPKFAVARVLVSNTRALRNFRSNSVKGRQRKPKIMKEKSNWIKTITLLKIFTKPTGSIISSSYNRVLSFKIF